MLRLFRLQLASMPLHVFLLLQGTLLLLATRVAGISAEAGVPAAACILAVTSIPVACVLLMRGYHYILTAWLSLVFL
jgi:hypothetical protein